MQTKKKLSDVRDKIILNKKIIYNSSLHARIQVHEDALTGCSLFSSFLTESPALESW